MSTKKKRLQYTQTDLALIYGSVTFSGDSPSIFAICTILILFRKNVMSSHLLPSIFQSLDMICRLLQKFLQHSCTELFTLHYIYITVLLLFLFIVIYLPVFLSFSKPLAVYMICMLISY